MDQQTVHAIAQKLSKPEVVTLGDNNKIALLPNGFTVTDLKQWMPPQPFVEQRVVLLTPDDFAEYVNTWGRPASALVFANEPQSKFEAVIDYHPPEDQTRGKCEHVAVYECPLSPAWKIWAAFDKKRLSQVEFGQFIEENLPNIIDPAAADMLQIALSLEVKKSVKFKSEQRLENGQRQFVYEEDIDGRAKQGTLTIPTSFYIAVPVYNGGEPRQVEARFRYRIDGDGKLLLWYELVRVQDILDAAVQAVTAQIAGKLKDIRLLRGQRS